MARVTRASAGKEASSLAVNHDVLSKTATSTNGKARTGKACSAKNLIPKNRLRNQSSTPTTPSLGHGHRLSRNTQWDVSNEETKEAANFGRKRKHFEDENHEHDYEDLPHNMGRARRVKREQAQGMEPIATRPPVNDRKLYGTPAKAENQVFKSYSPERETEIEQGARAYLSAKPTPMNQKAGNLDDEPRPSKDSKKPKAPKAPKTPKTNEYGLTPGVSPFPNYPHPTPEECHEVHRTLKGYHPECQGRPTTIPPPSQIVAGCGQVPSILDALIRTLLSAATTGKNSSSAYQGMVARYGNASKGVGKGSVDYNAVRLAPQSDLEAAISSGGLAKTKSKNIKAVLDLVYHENQERRRAHLASKANPTAATAPKDDQEETEEQKAAEIALAEDDVLSLDHYYTLPTYDAIFTFVKYPGIGVKTAACTALFCMQRSCFAVDTHVFRLAKWLGWVPPDDKRVNRDTTFSHLEVRIPDDLKYDLHQLLVKHGKTCPRCRASTGESSAKWEDGCVIDHLVKRMGPRKGANASPLKKQRSKSPSSAKKSKKRNEYSDNEDDAGEDVPTLDDGEER